MAKFVTEDGKGGISGDKLMDQLRRESDQSFNDMCFDSYPVKKRHTDIDKLKIPTGKRNRDRINNINDYDLFAHIQQTLSLTGRCILEMITNEDHRCINMNETIQRRIRQFASQYIDDAFRMEHPRSKVRVKTGEGPFDFKLVDETDEAWFDRLCHMYMHKNHPAKLQMIKCEECLQHWMNDDKW